MHLAFNPHSTCIRLSKHLAHLLVKWTHRGGGRGGRAKDLWAVQPFPWRYSKTVPTYNMLRIAVRTWRTPARTSVVLRAADRLQFGGWAGSMYVLSPENSNNILINDINVTVNHAWSFSLAISFHWCDHFISFHCIRSSIHFYLF